MSLDTYASEALRLMQMVAHSPQNTAWSLATITSYDRGAHTVRCTLQPTGQTTPALPALLGVAHPLRAGQQGIVFYAGGAPAFFLGPFSAEADPPPAAALSVEGDIYLTGVLHAAGGVQTSAGELLPAASADYDGQIVTVRPSDNSAAATASICLQSADGSYHWLLLATAP